jgi:hypothetical protein
MKSIMRARGASGVLCGAVSETELVATRRGVSPPSRRAMRSAIARACSSELLTSISTGAFKFQLNV